MTLNYYLLFLSFTFLPSFLVITFIRVILLWLFSFSNAYWVGFSFLHSLEAQKFALGEFCLPPPPRHLPFFFLTTTSPLIFCPGWVFSEEVWRSVISLYLQIIFDWFSTSNLNYTCYSSKQEQTQKMLLLVFLWFLEI